jgi:hypothetical protein
MGEVRKDIFQLDGCKVINPESFGILNVGYQEVREPKASLSESGVEVDFQGADLARSRLIAIKLLLLLLDIDVQCPGVEMRDSRQCRHTRVSGIIGPASEAKSPGTYRAM